MSTTVNCKLNNCLLQYQEDFLMVGSTDAPQNAIQIYKFNQEGLQLENNLYGSNAATLCLVKSQERSLLISGTTQGQLISWDLMSGRPNSSYQSSMSLIDDNSIITLDTVGENSYIYGTMKKEIFLHDLRQKHPQSVV